MYKPPSASFYFHYGKPRGRALCSLMDYSDTDAENSSDTSMPCSSTFFRCFVFVMLTFLFGLQVHTHFYGPKESLDGSFADIKYVVMQLTNGLSEVNRKHERLQSEMERVSAALPAVAAAAGRARDALGPVLRPGHAFEISDYDRQMGDYALESAGARVLDTGDTVGHFNYESPVSWALHVLTSWVCRECQSARTIIQPGNLPGQCWAFKGPTGEATIRLLGTIHVTGFSVEHIPAHIDPARTTLTAPRLIQLEGLSSRTDPNPHNFGTFEYVKDSSPIQYFEVMQSSPRGLNIVRIKVLSNWGHPVYTCVYRVRVHGELLPGQAPRNSLTSEEEIQVDNE